MEAILKELERRLSSMISALTAELGGIRGNRPSPALVEDLKIEYFEQQVPIKQLGSISILPPRELVLALWDPTAVALVAKELENAKRGFSIAVQGQGIRITLPPLSQERREELLKLAKAVSEKSKIQVRSNRDDANKKTEAAETLGAITEDQNTRGRKKIQELVDKANKDIEMLLQKKEKEIQE